MLRNKEEFLLRKKNMNLVDEMQLGVINLEKTYGVIKELTKQLFLKCVAEKEEETVRNGTGMQMEQ